MLPPHYRPLGNAAVWIPPSIYGSKNEPSFDDLRSIATPLLSLPLDNFLFNEAPRLLELQREDMKWHLNPLCRGCAYEGDCKQRAVRNGELGSMANIPIQDSEVLRSLLTVSGRKSSLTDIEDLHRLVGSKSRMENLQKSNASLLKKAKRILKIQGNTSPVIAAARTRQVQVRSRLIEFSQACVEFACLL